MAYIVRQTSQCHPEIDQYNQKPKTAVTMIAKQDEAHFSEPRERIDRSRIAGQNQSEQTLVSGDSC